MGSGFILTAKKVCNKEQKQRGCLAKASYSLQKHWFALNQKWLAPKSIARHHDAMPALSIF